VTADELWKYDGSTVSQVADINPGIAGSMPIPAWSFGNAYYFTADDGLHGTELWRLDPTSALVRITSLTRQGNDILLNWTSPGGMTNLVQRGMGSSVTDKFADRSAAMLAPAGYVVGMSYLDVGGATNSPSRFYRIRLGQ
jgi:ELWxxDGT repeat protein